MSDSTHKVPSWLMIASFLVIVLILILFTDVFTSVVGTLVMIGIYANGYDESHKNEHH